MILSNLYCKKVRKSINRILKNLKFLPKPLFYKIRYAAFTGKKLNLQNPVEISEKINWLKMYYHPKILTDLTNKFTVREYVKEKVGIEYLNEIYGYYESVDEIDFDKLPQQYILKAVHGCRKNLIVTDKNKLDIPNTKKTLNQWLTYNHYKKVGFEWAYKNIKPAIIVEKYLNEENHSILTDYKFYCFNGKFGFVFVVKEFEGVQLQAFYDKHFEKLPFNSKNRDCWIEEHHKLKKPLFFDKMIEIAEILADRFPYVRVDMYYIDNQIIFGEMTFYPGDGKYEFTPDIYNKIIGDQVILPELKKGQKEITNY